MTQLTSSSATVSYRDDDGGEEKGNERRLKRARRQSLHLVYFFTSIFLFMTFYDKYQTRFNNRNNLMKERLHRRREALRDAFSHEFNPAGNTINEQQQQQRRDLRPLHDDNRYAADGNGQNNKNRRRGKKDRKRRDVRDDDGRSNNRNLKGDDDDDDDDDDNDDKEEWVESPSRYSPSGRYKWVDPRLLPPIPGQPDNPNMLNLYKTFEKRNHRGNRHNRKGFSVSHYNDGAAAPWERQLSSLPLPHRPRVDYTTHSYSYPPFVDGPNSAMIKGNYPPLEPLGDILRAWPQHAMDDPPHPLKEGLLRFDFSNPVERSAAEKFRDAELPFKVYNVPEVTEAGRKWTDDYVGQQFEGGGGAKGVGERIMGGFRGDSQVPPSRGHCQESTNSFFAFFTDKHWDIPTMGPPPTLNNDWTYSQWAKHATYADATSLPPHETHYYFQSGVPKEERLAPKEEWTFVSRDLPSFSNPEPTFFGFHPEQQKGIQCRFGERGVTAATHYDAGRNMVAMITGAKRYILSPPNECSKLGIVTLRGHPEFRHSMLDFDHLNLLDEDTPDTNSMPNEEREWLKVAYSSLAISTVLKAGEVLYIPSHWFHYITSLQKSAQCNTRSGRSDYWSPQFGGYRDVEICMGEK